MEVEERLLMSEDQAVSKGMVASLWKLRTGHSDGLGAGFANNRQKLKTDSHLEPQKGHSPADTWIVAFETKQRNYPAHLSPAVSQGMLGIIRSQKNILSV